MRFLLTTALAGTLLTASGSAASPDVIRLTNDYSIVGDILAERTDRIIVDLGFTALVVPREQILQIVHDADLEGGALAASPVSAQTSPNGNPSLAPEDRDLYQYVPYPQGRPLEIRELAERLGEAVVQVRTPGGLGSGFIINKDGYLITNFHVIENETEISIEIYQKRDGRLERENYKDVRIVAMNKFADLALLKIETEDGTQFQSLPLGSTRPLRVGERVFAIGSPLGLERTVTEGILSTKTRQIQGALYLQTSTEINPGNSGGPLFNRYGQVIGVTNMKMNFAEGLAFAIPVETVHHFLDHREAYAYDNDNPSNPYRYLEPARRIPPEPGQPSK